MISYYQKTITSKKLKKVEEFKAGSWVHVEDPTEEEFLRLENDLKLDRGLLEDAVDLNIAKERLKEPRIPLAQVTAELKRDGLL